LWLADSYSLFQVLRCEYAVRGEVAIHAQVSWFSPSMFWKSISIYSFSANARREINRYLTFFFQHLQQQLQTQPGSLPFDEVIDNYNLQIT
jgi:hypothetical protein